MPITRRNGKYYWGRQGPFDTQAKAEEVAQAAYASGYKGSLHKLLRLTKMNRPSGVNDETWAAVDNYLNGQGSTFLTHKEHLAGARALAQLHNEATKGEGPQMNFDAKKPNSAYGRVGGKRKSLSPWQKDITGPRFADWKTVREHWWGEIAPLFVHPDTPEHERGLVDTLRNRVIQHETPGMGRKERAGQEMGYHGLSYMSGDDIKPMEDRSYGRFGRRQVTPGETKLGPEVTTPELPAFPEHRSNVDWRREGHAQTETEQIPMPKKKSIQKLMNFVQKADDGPPEYHPITGQRINAPTSGGRMGPNLTPSHIGGELEQQAFPDIHNWYDNIQSQAHLSPKEQNLYVPGVAMAPKKYIDVLKPQRMPLAGQEMGVHHDVEGKPSHEKDHSLLVEAELGHDKVDDERAGSQWVPGRFIGRPTHDGAYHQGFAHMVLDELYGRTHHGYNHGFNDLSAQMGSEYEGKYRDVYSHHPHNEHLDDLEEKPQEK